MNVGYKLHKAYKKYFNPAPVEKAKKKLVLPAKSSQTKVSTSSSKSKATVQMTLTRDGKVRNPKMSAESPGKALKSSKSPKKRRHSADSTESARRKKDKKKKKKKKKKRSKSRTEVELLDPALYVILSKKGEPWCRYCGAIETSGWSNGPWGPKRLCVVSDYYTIVTLTPKVHNSLQAHYVKWKKGGLELPSDEPKQPLQPLENTQFKYIAYKREKSKDREQSKQRTSLTSSSSQPHKKQRLDPSEVAEG